VADLRFAVRKALHKAGVLHRLRDLRGRRTHRPLFNPADPRTQVATLTCVDWLHQQGVLEGSDIMEFGIFRGFNVWFTQAYCRAKGMSDLRWLGFDSFFGLPAIEGIDASGSFKEGEFSAYREDVEYYFNRFGIDWSRTLLIDGFFSDTLNEKTKEQYQIRECALAIVDCDLYSSTVEVLQFLERLLAPLAVLYFDDWDDFKSADQGESRAFREFADRTRSQFTVVELQLPAGITKGKAFSLRRT
jgi:O-methyltransferase